MFCRTIIKVCTSFEIHSGKLVKKFKLECWLQRNIKSETFSSICVDCKTGYKSSFVVYVSKTATPNVHLALEGSTAYIFLLVIGRFTWTAKFKTHTITSVNIHIIKLSRKYLKLCPIIKTMVSRQVHRLINTASTGISVYVINNSLL